MLVDFWTRPHVSSCGPHSEPRVLGGWAEGPAWRPPVVPAQGQEAPPGSCSRGGCPSGLRAGGTALCPVRQGRARRLSTGRLVGLGQAPPCAGGQRQPSCPVESMGNYQGGSQPSRAPCPVSPPSSPQSLCAAWKLRVARGGPRSCRMVRRRAHPRTRVLEQPWLGLPMGPPRTALPQNPEPPPHLLLGTPLPSHWGWGCTGTGRSHACFLPMQQPRVYSTRKQTESR